MQEFIFQAGPVYAFMMVPILIPLLTVSIGSIADRFREPPAPGIRERLAEQRAREQRASVLVAAEAVEFDDVHRAA